MLVFVVDTNKKRINLIIYRSALFVETPREFIIAKRSTRKPVISTDEYPASRMESLRNKFTWCCHKTKLIHIIITKQNHQEPAVVRKVDRAVIGL